MINTLVTVVNNALGYQEEIEFQYVSLWTRNLN